MTLGSYISGVGHLGLVTWMVLGWGMQAEPLPFEITEVSVVSGDDFAALTQGVQPDVPSGALPELTPPEIVPDVPAPAAQAEPTPAPEVTPPDPIEAPVLEAPPEAPDLTVPETVVTDVAPDIPSTPTIVAPPPSAELGDSPRPVARPSERVTPELVAPPPPDAEVAPEVAEVAEEQPDAPDPLEEPVEETTAPEQSAPEIVTEAEEPAFAEEISLAPTTSARPQVRPNRPAPEVAEAVDPVQAALDAAGAGEADTDPAPTPDPTPGLAGGDISDRARANLTNEISGCWELGSVSTAVSNTVITVEWVMNPDGTIDTGSFDLVGFEGGSQADADIAYRVARSALVRCVNNGGRSGYTLPEDQFDSPRRLRLTFDMSVMRLR